MLSIKQILTVKDGEMSPVTRVHTRAAGMNYLYNFIAGFPNIEEMAVEHTTNLDEANKLMERSSALFPKERIYRSTVSPVLGTYAGPNALAVTVLEAEKK
jgi:fatty acid-binding protein DegV